MMNKNFLLKLAAVQTFIIALSNWLVTYKFSVFGNPLTFAVFTLPISLVVTDLTIRLANKRLAQSVVLLATLPGMILTAIILLLSGANDYTIERITIASGIANCLPVLVDISVFSWIRQKFTQWWAAPLTSGFVTALIMTYTFYGTAFAYHATNTFMAENWYIVATNQMLGKMIINLVVLLPLYGIFLNYLQKRMTIANMA